MSIIYKRRKTIFGQSRFICFYCGEEFRRLRRLEAHYDDEGSDCYQKALVIMQSHGLMLDKARLL